MQILTHNRQTRPELLAPAGDWESLRAAVANGADAVYFGLPEFNARHRATNFGPGELPAVIRFLHNRNVKGFVTLNTLLFSDELPAVVDYVRSIAASGADAVIVQDLGLVHLIKRLAPRLPVHASTQMTLTEPRGIAFAQRLGVERVVLARELSLDEIRKITATTDTPVEVFVHGALCVAYSGQCLTSEALGGRSANRGQCAQACRLPYELYVDGRRHDLGDRAYLLSPQDLAAYDLIAELAEAGVASFKIEGRLKGAPYVAAATQTYRAAINAACASRPFDLPRAQARDLAQTFSRGFTPGFLKGVDHQKLVRGQFPKSRGNLIGTVTGITRHGVKVRLHETCPVEQIVKTGDGVVFDIGEPEGKEQGGRVWKIDVNRASGAPRVQDGGEVVLMFDRESIDLPHIPVGCKVWKTDDPALRKRLEQSFAADRPAKRSTLAITVSGAAGAPLRIVVQETGGNTVTVEWPGPLEIARKQPLDLSTLIEQFDRLVDTPFELGPVVLNLTDHVMVPKSVLNDLRREAVGRLMEQREQRYQVDDRNALQQIRAGIIDRINPSTSSSAILNVLVRTLEQLEKVLDWTAETPSPSTPIETIYCDFEDTRRYRDAVQMARAANRPIGLATLRIIKPGEEGFLRPILTAAPDVVLVRNLAALDYFRHALPSAKLVGDFSLNVANEITADLMVREGLASLAPSYDLNWEQLAALVRNSDPDWYEPVIHQHMPMFHMEHCVFAAFLSNGKDHRDCGRPCDRHRLELRDRVGAEFPVVPDTGCRNTVFNSVAQSAAEYLTRMRALGLRRFRIDLLREGPKQIDTLLDYYTRALAGLDNGRETWRKLQALDQLGVTRGTLQLV